MWRPEQVFESLRSPDVGDSAPVCIDLVTERGMFGSPGCCGAPPAPALVLEGGSWLAWNGPEVWQRAVGSTEVSEYVVAGVVSDDETGMSPV